MSNDKYLDFATNLARESAQIMLEHFEIGKDTITKSDDSPVTIADTAINSLVIERVKETYPDHTILGEEESHGDHADTEFTWVVDPIDGTRPYAMGIPTNVFSLALTSHGESIVAVVFDPYMSRMYTAVKGHGAFLNGEPIHVNSRDSIDQFTHFGLESYLNKFRMSLLGEMGENKAHHVSVGSNVYACMLVALGQLDFVVFSGKTAHDAVTADLIIREAGGKSTDLDGNDQRYDQPINGSIISNGKIDGIVKNAVKRALAAAN